MYSVHFSFCNLALFLYPFLEFLGCSANLREKWRVLFEVASLAYNSDLTRKGHVIHLRKIIVDNAV
jgi:hypothetical protein